MVSYLAVAVVCFFLALIGAELVQAQMNFGQMSPAMRLPMWVAYLALPVGFGLSVIRNLSLAFESFNKIRKNDFQAPEAGSDTSEVKEA